MGAGVVALGLAPIAGAETAHTCFGQTATMVGTDDSEFMYGSDRGTDVIVGLDDVIVGLDGGDEIDRESGRLLVRL